MLKPDDLEEFVLVEWDNGYAFQEYHKDITLIDPEDYQ